MDAIEIVRLLGTCIALILGATIERVAFCSKDKAHKIRDGLGFEDVVRADNIKMVTWKAE